MHKDANKFSYHENRSQKNLIYILLMTNINNFPTKLHLLQSDSI